MDIAILFTSTKAHQNNMNIANLKKTYPVLIRHMENEGFGKVAIGSVKVRLRLLFEHEGEYVSYEDFYSRFISGEGLTGNNRRLRYYRTSVRTIQAFDEYGHLPNRLKFAPVQYRASALNNLNEHYRSMVETYKSYAVKRGLSNKTILVVTNAASKFFYHLQLNGECQPKDITESSVISFFHSDGQSKRGHAYLAKVRQVLNVCILCGQSELVKILAYLPNIKKGSKIYAVLKDSEVDVVKQKLADDDVSIRDKAIISSALYTGMRGTDLARLTVENIDWDNDRIAFVQSKTGQPVVLPLLASIGNPLVDYLLSSRPKENTLSNIFLNQNSPQTPMKGETVGGIARRFFAKCGINPPIGQNGIRLFRRYLASKALRNGDAPTVISSILGHCCRESLNPYLDIDIEHLRECGLDISMFPVGKEVFDV